MKHYVILGLGVALFLTITMGVIGHGSEPPEINVTLRITSSIAREQIGFNAAYIVGGRTGKPQFGTFQTPYELSISASNGYVAGRFNRTKGNASLNVEIVLSQNGHTLVTMNGSGSLVVISTIHDMINSTDSYSVNAF